MSHSNLVNNRVPPVRQKSFDEHGELPRLMRQASESCVRDSCAPAEFFVARLGDEIDRQSWRLVDARGSSLVARRAASCLLMPSRGDLVQVLVSGSSSWVVAVLERDAMAACTAIDLGDADVEVRAGSLAFHAHRDITHQAIQLCSTSSLVREITEEKSSLVRQSSVVQVGSMAINVDRHLGVHAKLATISADALLKLDGAQIHMG